jgi:hypothetical protein
MGGMVQGMSREKARRGDGCRKGSRNGRSDLTKYKREGM